MTEESMPLTQEQARQLNRNLTEKILDRAASDPAWKQQLLDDPEAALRAANFPETQQIQRMQGEQAEVRGHGTGPYRPWPNPDPGRYGGCRWTWYCIWWTLRWWNDEWN